MQPSEKPGPDRAILDALRGRAGGRAVIGFDEFMEVALYEPGAGYYRRNRRRIGYGPGSDFLTASASAPLFGRLVLEACVRLLAPEAPGRYEFVEIGAEPGGGILRGLPHPFRGARAIGVGEPVRILGPAVVFSNELFDAQPFRRLRFREGAWREWGVRVSGGALSLEELPDAPPLPAGLPERAAEGYVIDAPLASVSLLRDLTGPSWQGLFLALDYGKSWEELSLAAPEGTARAYRGHVQSNDLLAHPGDQDLTCHLCWDWLSDALLCAGFAEPRLESQEAFFVHHAGEFMAALSAAEAGRLSRDKLSLFQLIHPAHMGQKFQALWALRLPRAHPPIPVRIPLPTD
ncbi:MAG: SAM-dependent methyltransferase [Opitutaceae bacterium]